MTTDANNVFHRNRLRCQVAALSDAQIAMAVPYGVDVDYVRSLLLARIGDIGPHDELTERTTWRDLLDQMARDYVDDSLSAQMIGY